MLSAVVCRQVRLVSFRRRRICAALRVDNPRLLFTTARRLLFGVDASGNFIVDAGTGETLWHARIGQVTNAPETYASEAGSTFSWPQASRCLRSQ